MWVPHELLQAYATAGGFLSFWAQNGLVLCKIAEWLHSAEAMIFDRDIQHKHTHTPKLLSLPLTNWSKVPVTGSLAPRPASVCLLYAYKSWLSSHLSCLFLWWCWEKPEGLFCSITWGGGAGELALAVSKEHTGSPEGWARCVAEAWENESWDP